MSQSFDQTPEIDPDCLHRNVENELATLLFSMTPIVLVANLVNGTLIASVFFGPETARLVVAWWVSLLVVMAARGALWVRYRDRNGGDDRRRFLIAILGSAASGTLWGAAGFLFVPSASETQRMVLGFILGGMGAGAVTALTPSLAAFYSYLFPAVVPFCVQLVRQGDHDHLTMAAACVLYLISLALVGRRANSWLKESIARRLENAALVRSLERRVEERTTRLAQVNEQLRQDIAERRRAEAALARYGERQAAIAAFGRLALSGIDLDQLFGVAVELVRDGLGVAGALVVEEPAGARQAVPRAMAGLPVASSLGPLGVALAARPPGPFDTAPGGTPLDDRALDLRRLRDPETSSEAVICQQDRPFGVLVAVDIAPRAYSVNDVNFLQSIANMLAAAIDRKRAEHDIQRLALRDPLTGLPNRALFRDRLRQELARSERSGRMLAVLLVDLDDFKDVNDTLGHPVGDRLLVAVAERLMACLRQVDAPARLGGDEFAIIVSDLRAREDAARVAREVVEVLSEPFHLDDRDLYIGASVGVTVSPRDGTEVDDLLRTVDLALYRAKADGRNTHRFYAPDMAAEVEARKALEHDLRHALERDEFCLVYQPQFDLRSHRPIGAEALLRWRHPTRGLLLPDAFIAVAETVGLIVRLGRCVLECATKQMLDWRRQGLPPVRIATNISLNECRRGDLVATIEGIATRTGGDLDWLEIEVTEHLFLPPGNGEAVATLRHLSELGVTISIDDFGTGYSSLGRLKGLPVDKVKIDKSFIAELGASRDAETLVRAIIALAHSLSLTVTAEGVESRRQLNFLIAEGCDCAQGYYLGRPLSPREFADLLRGDGGGLAPIRLARGE